MKTLSLLACAIVGLAACTTTPSDSGTVNRPGSWQVAFVRLVDLSGPPYVEEQPAPEYPTRIMQAPTADVASCMPGCDCAFVSAGEVCEGELAQNCRAWGGFVETCPEDHTRLDCSNIVFESDEHTTGVCVLEDITVMTEFGYELIQRYKVTLDRIAYD